MGISEAEFGALRDRFTSNALTQMPTIKPVRSKRNKYGVAPAAERTIDGITFASKAEAVAYQQLLAAKSAGQIIGEIELQPRFKFVQGFEYRGDFRVTWASGETETIDVKGVETPVFRLKRKMMAYHYPEVKLSLWGKR